MYNLNEEMGKRISVLRKEHHMTQEVFAEKLDISIKHCSAVERGLASLSLERLMDCCDLFDTSLDFIIRGESSSRVARVPDMVVDFYHQSSHDEQALMTEYINLFKKIQHLNSTTDSKDKKIL